MSGRICFRCITLAYLAKRMDYFDICQNIYQKLNDIPTFVILNVLLLTFSAKTDANFIRSSLTLSVYMREKIDNYQSEA